MSRITVLEIAPFLDKERTMAQRIAITGASGFIGKHLVSKARLHASDVLALDIEPSPGVQMCDILDQLSLRSHFMAFRPDVVLHAAARTDLRGGRLEDYGANLDGTRNAIVSAREAGATRFVHFSSRLVFRLGHAPRHEFDYSATTPYGLSKAISEGIVLSTDGIESCIVRPTSIWGPGFGTPYRGFFDAVHRRLYLHPRGLEVWKDFGYIENCVAQVLSLLDEDSKVQSRVYWLKDAPLELGAFADMIANNFGVAPPRRTPLPVLKALALAGDGMERLGLTAPLTTFRLHNLVTPMLYGDTNLLPAKSISLDQGVQSTCDWLRFTDGGK
jgi:nucleoside-diphosphate-sugar epimerase